ncbi:MAG: hypothetical protein ACK401_07715 [Archaeoglobaceae archaeon]
MGSRLGHHTAEIPKCVLVVGEKTIIEHSIEVISSFRVRRFVIVTGHKGGKLRKFLETRFDFDFSFVHKPLGEEEMKVIVENTRVVRMQKDPTEKAGGNASDWQRSHGESLRY